MKVLFVNCTNFLDATLPGGISILSSVLKKYGHEVALFDTAFLKPKNWSKDKEKKIKKKLSGGIAFHKSTPYSLKDLVTNDPQVDIVEEFSKFINEFNPSLIAVSAMTTNYEKSLDLIKKINLKCKVIFGGVHPTLMPESVINQKEIDFVCIGEGDEALPELCHYLENNNDISGIKNLYIKPEKECDGRVIKNDLRPFVDLDSLPIPDLSIFDPRYFFRPFLGNIYKGIFMSTSRGCPRGCAYCVNDKLRTLFKGCGAHYMRFQSPRIVARNIEFLRNKYEITWFKFSDDTFLLRPLEQLYELKDLLKPLDIMFGCSVDPATVTEEKVKVAKEMGCVAMSIGIETGNEKIRRDVLNRHISNQQIKNAIGIVKNYGIKISTFNVIGLPGETKENVYETIRFNKELEIPDANVYILYPFPGTSIYEDYKVSLEDHGHIPPMDEAYIFNLSKMKKEDLLFFLKTFNLYLVL
ncbi:MAG TPA: hypothetical protein DHV62_00630, partial [Elusimicrobia bacterium]|nr:hypothetical protein [Elusimicrobiota bacterium]